MKTLGEYLTSFIASPAPKNHPKGTFVEGSRENFLNPNFLPFRASIRYLVVVYQNLLNIYDSTFVMLYHYRAVRVKLN